MVAPSGKAPNRPLSETEQKKLRLETERRERHQRRQRQNAQPQSELKERIARQKAAYAEAMAAALAKKAAAEREAAEAKAVAEAKPTSRSEARQSRRSGDSLANPPVSTGEDAGARAEEKDSDSVARRPRQAAKARATAAHHALAGDSVRHAMDDLLTAVQLTAELESSGEEDDSQDPVPDMLALDPTLPSPQRQVSASDPTSIEVGEPGTPSSGSSRGGAQPPSVRKRKRAEQLNDEADSYDEAEGSDAPLPADVTATIPDDDPCFTTTRGALEDTALNSESEESSSEDGDSDGIEENWELTFSSDEEEEDAAEELPNSRFLQTATNKRLMSEMRHSGWEYDPAAFGPDPSYSRLYNGPYGPTESVLAIAEDPLALFFFFLPAKLWRKIEEETNRYHVQNIPQRALAIQQAQRKQNKNDVEPIAALRRRLHNVAPVAPWEILRVIGLLIARMLCPHSRGLAAHWGRSRHGAVPVGTFGQWLSRNRFDHVMQNLHFTNNRSPRATTDRGWKVRSVVASLQKTFARGYVAGPVIAFDEAIIPTRARRNPTRQYLPKKPHKWGTKFFSACCGDTAYCMRIELYVGAKTNMATPPPADNSSGAAAVMRNMNALLPPSPTAPFRVVVTDRFYTSVVLALELLHRRLYLTGTIQTNRSGYAKDVITKKKVHKNRPPDPPRGTLKLAANKSFPLMTACMWMDNNPVHLLSTGGSRVLGPVLRRVGRERQNFPAPGLVMDYQRWMGGVDVHDQLRLQRYSIQLAYKPKKYYRSLFFGLVDMALVNAFIVHRYHLKGTGQRAPDHSKFFQTLHEQLLAVDSEKFEEIEVATRAEDRTAASPQQATLSPSLGREDPGHFLEQCPDKKKTNRPLSNGQLGKKRTARTCKVCATYRVKPRKYTKWFCPGCSDGELRKHLCNVVREGRSKTCFQIWHADWKKGSAIPASLTELHRIQDRRPGPQRKRRQRVTENAASGETQIETQSATGEESAADGEYETEGACGEGPHAGNANSDECSESE